MMDFYILLCTVFFATIAICGLLDMTPAGRKLSDILFAIIFFPVMLLFGVIQTLIKK